MAREEELERIKVVEDVNDPVKEVGKVEGNSNGKIRYD